MDLKLGCRLSTRAQIDRHLKVSEFRVALPEFPAAMDLFATSSNPLQMWLNANRGICTIAALKNMRLMWHGQRKEVLPDTDADALRDYSIVGGFDPSQDVTAPDGSVYNPTDNGANMTEVLQDWQNGRLGDKAIGAYLSVNVPDWEESLFAMYRGEGLYSALDLPQGAMDAMALPGPKIWTPPTTRTGRKLCGGHCTMQAAYDLKGLSVETGTWAEKVHTVADFWTEYYHEAYLIISEEQLNSQGINAFGLNMAAIRDALVDVKKHRGEQVQGGLEPRVHFGQGF